MNEDALRALVRESIARHLGDTSRVDPGAPQPMIVARHASHYRYALPPSGGPCLIEPNVQCNHCGYCESHGH
jgi:hypothetical protein